MRDEQVEQVKDIDTRNSSQDKSEPPNTTASSES